MEIETVEIPEHSIKSMFAQLQLLNEKVETLVQFTTQFAGAMRSAASNPMVRMMMPQEARNAMENMLVVGSFGTSESDT